MAASYYRQRPEKRAAKAAADKAWKKTAKGLLSQNRCNRTVNGRYRVLKYMAKRHPPFEITKDQYVLLVVGATCEYCGEPLGGAGYGLDRKDSAKGYTLDNVVPCCGPCNKIKNKHLTYAEMKVAMAAVMLLRSMKP